MTIGEIYEKYNALWGVMEFDVKSKPLRESGRYYGVEDRDGNKIANFVTKETATLIALAPEMFVLVQQVAEGNSEHAPQAKMVLGMMNMRKTLCQRDNP
jgi:hypothetical protein